MDELLEELQKRKEALPFMRERLYAPIDPDRNKTLREFKAPEAKIRDLEFRIQNVGSTLTHSIWTAMWDLPAGGEPFINHFANAV